MGDQEDKQWLYENGHLPITGGKVKIVPCFIRRGWSDTCLNATSHKSYLDALYAIFAGRCVFILNCVGARRLTRKASWEAILRGKNSHQEKNYIASGKENCIV